VSKTSDKTADLHAKNLVTLISTMLIIIYTYYPLYLIYLLLKIAFVIDGLSDLCNSQKILIRNWTKVKGHNKMCSYLCS